MEQEFKFRIQSLLSQKEDKVSGPMSPMLFAEEMAKLPFWKQQKIYIKSIELVDFSIFDPNNAGMNNDYLKTHLL